jgi:hypothetical protein
MSIEPKRLRVIGRCRPPVFLKTSSPKILKSFPISSLGVASNPAKTFAYGLLEVWPSSANSPLLVAKLIIWFYAPSGLISTIWRPLDIDLVRLETLFKNGLFLHESTKITDNFVASCVIDIRSSNGIASYLIKSRLVPIESTGMR